jgi:hypothetical protein
MCVYTTAGANTAYNKPHHLVTARLRYIDAILELAFHDIRREQAQKGSQKLSFKCRRLEM